MGNECAAGTFEQRGVELDNADFRRETELPGFQEDVAGVYTLEVFELLKTRRSGFNIS